MAEPVIPRCRRMTKAGIRCGHRLEPAGDFLWCSRNTVDVITGKRGCGLHWVKEVVDSWPRDDATSQ